MSSYDRMAAEIHRGIGKAMRDAGAKVTVRGPQGLIVDQDASCRTVVLRSYARAGSFFGSRMREVIGDVWRFHIDHFSIRRPRQYRLATPDGYPPIELSCASDELQLIASWIPSYFAGTDARFPCEIDSPVVYGYVWTIRAHEMYGQPKPPGWKYNQQGGA